MTREIAAPLAVEAKEPVIHPFVAVELEFSSGEVRACSLNVSIFFDSNSDTVEEEFHGVGNLGKISGIQEGSELQAYDCTVTLSGIPSELIAIALGEHYQGRKGRIWIGLLQDGIATQIVGAPVLIFAGRMDNMDVVYGAKESQIAVKLVNILADWERPRGLRWNSASQNVRFPDDKGFDFVPQTVEKELIWGRA